MRIEQSKRKVCYLILVSLSCQRIVFNVLPFGVSISGEPLPVFGVSPLGVWLSDVTLFLVFDL